MPYDTRILYKECATLAQSGNEVVLIVPGTDDANINGVQIRCVPKPTTRSERMTRTALSVVQSGLKENADIYHIHDPELLPWAQYLRIRGKRVIYDMHENIPGAILTKPWIAPNLRKWAATVYRWTERLLLTGLPVVYAEESYVSEYAWVTDFIIVLNLPKIDQLTFITELKNPIFTVGYMGGVDPDRGSTITLKALGLLREKGIDIHFECVGPMNANHAKELRALQMKAGLKGVYFHGRLPQDNGWHLMAACDVGLALLRDTQNYRDSYPTKMFEYMALGLPIIVSDFPLYRQIIERAQCGICVNPDNLDAVADAMQFFHSQPHIAKIMGENGRRFVQNEMNWDSEARKLLLFYRRQLAK